MRRCGEIISSQWGIGGYEYETNNRMRFKSFSVGCCLPTTTPSPSNKSMLILGFGFVGNFLAQQLKTTGWVVGGTCTSITKKQRLEEMGFNVHLFDANEPDPDILDYINCHSHLLVSVPPIVGIGDPMLQYGETLKSGLMEGNLKWLGYLSSTSVYGDCGGQWVDEDYAVAPTDEKGKARLAAEEGWLKLSNDLGISTQIFRLGGIYGPGRSAVDTLMKQEPMSENQKKRIPRYYTSRVHVADICQTLRASMDKPSFGKIYNVVDDDPAPRAEVFSYARNLIDGKLSGHMKQHDVSSNGPQIQASDLTSLMGKKRVSNERIKTELGVELLYPNYKSGLKSIVEHMANPFL